MYCQKCRTPLVLDKSLENLNPAAFDLLVGSTGKTLPTSEGVSLLNYPRERRQLYDQAAPGALPVYKRSINAPAENDEALTRDTSKSRVARSMQPEMSFVDISKSQVVPAHEVGRQESRRSQVKKPMKPAVVQPEDVKPSLSWEQQREERLFSILSSHSDIDHPVCTECTSLLLSSFNARLASANRERDAYVSFLKSLLSAASTIPTAEQVAAAEKELKAVQDKERAALEELRQLEEEKCTLEVELADLEDESRALELDERAFWQSRNTFDEEMHDLNIDLITLQQRHANDQTQLEKLQRTNVYNDTFCIGHDGYFGTINGLRLGRLPNHMVDWSEINAAWGQTLLLLATVAERLGYDFKGYRLRPLGSTSRIDKVEWPQQTPEEQAKQSTTGGGERSDSKPAPKLTPLDLFSSGDMPLGRVFYHRRFDAGMVAFLECLAQLGEYLEKKTATPATGDRPSPARRTSSRIVPDQQRVLPYSIQGDKIGATSTSAGVSIRLGAGFAQDESWTKACKYTLTCCKYLLAHVSNMAGPMDGRE